LMDMGNENVRNLSRAEAEREPAFSKPGPAVILRGAREDVARLGEANGSACPHPPEDTCISRRTHHARVAVAMSDLTRDHTTAFFFPSITSRTTWAFHTMPRSDSWLIRPE